MIVVNGVEVSKRDQVRFERLTGARLPAGNWWYDPISGAWGAAGSPTLGFTRPGIGCFAPLRADASRGTGFLAAVFNRSRVYLNGRELHMSEAQWLMQLLGMGAVWPGSRYTMDHAGNFGREGQRPEINLFAAVAQARAMAALSQSGGGGAGRGYLHRTSSGYVGGDGNTGYFFDPQTGSSAMV
jgi:hypothetical protein